MTEVLEFVVSDSHYGVPAARVVEVALRVLITPLPGTAPPVLGVIAYRGEPVPVVDVRARFGHPARAEQLDDHFIIARGAKRTVALVVDRVLGLRTVDPSALHPTPAPSQHVAGIVTIDDGLLLVEDLDAALSLEEESAVTEGMQRLGAGA